MPGKLRYSSCSNCIVQNKACNFMGCSVSQYQAEKKSRSQPAWGKQTCGVSM